MEAAIIIKKALVIKLKSNSLIVLVISLLFTVW